MEEKYIFTEYADMLSWFNRGNSNNCSYRLYEKYFCDRLISTTLTLLKVIFINVPYIELTIVLTEKFNLELVGWISWGIPPFWNTSLSPIFLHYRLFFWHFARAASQAGIIFLSPGWSWYNRMIYFTIAAWTVATDQLRSHLQNGGEWYRAILTFSLALGRFFSIQIT